MLEEYQDIVREYAKGQPGIYALYRRGKLHYVGLASNLPARLKQHLRDRHGSSWDQFSIYLTIGDQHMKELESMILRIVDPPGNKVTGKFARSENLKLRVRQDVRNRLREKEESLLGEAPARKPKKKAKTKKKARTSAAAAVKSNARQPVLAPYLTKIRGGKLRAHYKGKTIRARVRKDGTISSGGVVYRSPSTAAAGVIDRNTCNGWRFWKYERSPGNWLKLEELRK